MRYKDNQSHRVNSERHKIMIKLSLPLFIVWTGICYATHPMDHSISKARENATIEKNIHKSQKNYYSKHLYKPDEFYPYYDTTSNNGNFFYDEYGNEEN